MILRLILGQIQILVHNGAQLYSLVGLIFSMINKLFPNNFHNKLVQLFPISLKSRFMETRKLSFNVPFFPPCTICLERKNLKHLDALSLASLQNKIKNLNVFSYTSDLNYLIFSMHQSMYTYPL